MSTRKNMKKADRYKEVFDNYNVAMENKIYVAAILLDYAMLEDRLTVLLKLIGAINPNDGKFRKKLIAEVENLAIQFVPEEFTNEHHTRKYTDIQAKINIMKALILWHENEYEIENRVPMLFKFKKQLECIDTGAILEMLPQLEDWKIKRNSIVHDLMNTENEFCEDDLYKLASDGCSFVRTIDKEIKSLRNRL